MPKKKTKTKSKSSSPKSDTQTTKVVSVPVARTTTERAQGPRMTQTRDGAIRVRRREFVGTVTNGSTTDFCIDTNSQASPGWDFNPGNSMMFPWLSILAPSYERYRFHSLSFDLVSSQASSTAGRVYAAVDYDWDDEVPETKAQLMGNLTAQEAPVWNNLKIVTDPRQLHRDMPYKYVNLAQRVAYSEPRTTYAGFLIIGFDTPTTNCKFDLFVTYDIELEVPVYENVGATLSNPLPLAPTTPYVADLNPWYTWTNAGAASKGILALWTTTNAFDHIREVIGGTGDVPTLALPSGFVGLAQRALDIGRLGNEHRLTFEGYLQEATTSPAAWIPHSTADGWVFGGSGNYLGALKQTPSTPVSGLTCTDLDCTSPQTLLSTAGAPARPRLGFSLRSLRAVYPGARYLVPFLAVANALGLGAVPGKCGIDYRVW